MSTTGSPILNIILPPGVPLGAPTAPIVAQIGTKRSWESARSAGLPELSRLGQGKDDFSSIPVISRPLRRRMGVVLFVEVT